MEKLIELLNEFLEKNYPKKNLVKDIIDDDYFVNNRNNEDGFLCETIMSKKFGFIKWLVENDKIEMRDDFYLEDEHGGGFGEDENIIMLLSIQDEPIKFLISILK